MLKEEKKMAKVSFEGIGEVVATFQAASGVKMGQVVKMTANGQVGPCSAGDHFCGVAAAAEDGLAAVQLKGCAELKTDGSVTSAGWVKLVAAANGAVKADTTNGKEFLAVEADATGKTVTVLL